MRPTQEPTPLVVEQAALRRVATLVAGGASPAEVFEAVVAEVGHVVTADVAALSRDEHDGTITLIGHWTRSDGYTAIGTRHATDDTTLARAVAETGRPARVDSYPGPPGPHTGPARTLGWRSSIGAPIVVDGQNWGVMSVGSTTDRPLPADTEVRLAEFTELLGLAVASAKSREEVAGLAEQQGALRRVATLVAQGRSQAELFAAVAREIAQVVRLSMVGVARYDDDAAMTVVAAWSDRPHNFKVGTRWPLDAGSMSERVKRTGRPARVEHYRDVPGALAAEARASGRTRTAGAPIIVDGLVWGVVVASSPEGPFAEDVEDRLAEFTDLLATAISNSQAREDVHRLAEEQAALRRVATLVAQDAPATELFAAVTTEICRLIPADAAGLARYEADGTLTALATWNRAGPHRGAARHFPHEPVELSRLILETRRPGRIDSYAGADGDTNPIARELGWRSSVGAPVIVGGRLWGVVAAASTSDQALPVDTEHRLAEFTDLVATAIANAESRAELAASRTRIVATADATRRKIERDLHDGAQQRLVSLALELRATQALVPADDSTLRSELSHAVDELIGVMDELRDIAHGIHPATLADGGLGPALKTLGRRAALPVELDVRTEMRLAEPVEVTAYYVVAEALTNAAKYAAASVVQVDVDVRDRALIVDVRDDGRGGADPRRGSGLLGLRDRAEAIGGTMSLYSPPGQGTSLHVVLPLGHDDQ